MALTPGAKLGPYEIQSHLGAGGMGEVYQARDTRLDRSVAVKVLREHVSESPEAQQRFDREARAISSLSHPNICALYDVGSQDSVSYIVMEFLRGPSRFEFLRAVCRELRRAEFRGVWRKHIRETMHGTPFLCHLRVIACKSLNRKTGTRSCKAGSESPKGFSKATHGSRY